ncbi:putative phosphoglycerate mutase family protein [Rhizoctonia solani]|nr:putative phosphoglycerate mutase family protein [Rhizoctonia solani]
MVWAIAAPLSCWNGISTVPAQAYDQVTQRPHEASWTHELIAGAAAFEAAKAYENHVAENGQPDNHATAKELLAGFTGAFVDHEVETRGLDYIDRERAQRHAQQQAEEALSQQGYY